MDEDNKSITEMPVIDLHINTSDDMHISSDEERGITINTSNRSENDLLKREVLCYLRLAALAKHDDARETYIEDAMTIMRRIIKEANHGEI